MRSQDYLNKRERSVMDLRERLQDVLNFHLDKLQDDEDLTPKDRIELIGRLLPFTINKIAADKESNLPKAQRDPLESF